MTQLARALNSRGLSVTTVTSQPTYQGQAKEKLPYRDQYKGVEIRRLPTTQLDKENLFLRTINWLSFALSLCGWLILREKSRDQIYACVTMPPLLPYLLGFFNLLFGISYVIIVYDVYPDLVAKKGLISEDSFLCKLWDWFNRFAYKRANRLVVLDENMKANLKSKMRGDDSIEDKIRIIPNWEDPDFIKPRRKADNEFSRRHGYDDVFTVLYSGNIGFQHDLETVIESASRTGEEEIRYVIIGEGKKKDKIVRMVSERGLSNVDFHPYQPKENLPRTLTCADVTILTEDKKMRGICVSCKIYSALASGQAVIGISDPLSEVSRVIDRANAGDHVRQGDAESFAGILRDWKNSPGKIRQYGENAREYFMNHYTLEQTASKYDQMFKNVLNNQPG